MGEILKFPKEKVQYINIITELKEYKKYQEIIKYQERLFQNFDLLRDSFVFDYLALAFFELGYYQDVIDIYYELSKLKYESFHILYLTLPSLIAKDDIYQASYLIKKSNLLKDESFTSYLASDEANFFNLTSLDDDAFGDVILTLVLVNYIQAIAKESLYQDITSEYLLYRFYDLINIILEVGFSEKIINDLNELGHKIFILK